MKRRAFLLGSGSALLAPRGSEAAYNTFNSFFSGVPPAAALLAGAGGWNASATVSSSAGQIASIPLASFNITFNQSGGPVANGDGTTGFSNNGGTTILQSWFNFPTDQFYQFVVPAFSGTWNGGQSNPLSVRIDQIPIQADGGNQSNLNYYLYFVSNLGTPTNYSFTAAVTAGWHSIQILMNFINPGYTLSGITDTNFHGDRLNIIATGTSLPAEPSPQTRDPGQFPMSSWHFINTPFGAGATWLALSDPIAKVINGTGGNGASIFPSILTDSVNNWYGQANDPIWTLYNPNDAIEFPSPTVGLQYPVRAPAGVYPTFGSSDKGIAITDTTNPRFRYQGGGLFGWGDRTINYGTLFVQDSYNLNHSMPQTTTNGRGILTVQDLESGVIAHRLQGGLAAYTGANNVGYGPTQQTSSFGSLPPQNSSYSGLLWPGSNSDHDWNPPTNRYGNPIGPPYNSVLGIPPGIAKPGGLNAGTSMFWDCMQHYGLFLNVSAGGANTAGITLHVEGAASNHPIFNQINFSTIVPNLSVLSNPAPIVLNTSNPQGYGGGNVIVPILPGLVQGYPSLGLPPYTFPASPVGIPIECATNADGGGNPSGTSLGSVNSSNVAIGSFVFIVLTFDQSQNTTVHFTSVTDNATGGSNTYTIVQPAAVAGVNTIAIAYCLSTTHAMPPGTTWTVNLTPTGQVNFYLLAGFYRPAPPTGSTTLRASNSTSTASTVSGLSTSLAGVQTGDLIVSAARVNHYAKIMAPAGFTALVPMPPILISSQVAPSSGTLTVNPTWAAFPDGGALVAAAFANANIAT